MTRYLLLIATLLFWTSSTTAQSYDLAAGVRLGTDLGISAKLRIPPLDENVTAEFLLTTSLERSEGQLAVLVAQHLPLITRRLNLYVGGGPHFGWLETDPDRVITYDNPAGLTVIGGAEVNFKKINISVDYKPSVNIIGGQKTFYSQTGVSLRYILIDRYGIFESPKEKRKKARQRERERRRKQRAAAGKKSWQFWKKGDAENLIWY